MPEYKHPETIIELQRLLYTRDIEPGHERKDLKDWYNSLSDEEKQEVTIYLKEIVNIAIDAFQPLIETIGLAMQGIIEAFEKLNSPELVEYLEGLEDKDNA